MCRSSYDTGGPRRCPEDARERYAASLAELGRLQQLLAEYRDPDLPTLPAPRHALPPAEFSAEHYDELRRWGLRVWGAQTVADYPIIGQRRDDVEAWGFEFDRRGVPEPWHLLEDGDEPFLEEVLTGEKSASLTAYTCGWSSQINAAITGDEPPPVDPEAKHMAAQILSAFSKFATHISRPEHRRTPAIVVRGSAIPPGWHEHPQRFFDEVFTVGSRFETGAVSSTSAAVRTALSFAEDEHSYLAVIQTHEGMPLTPIAMDPFEDETVLAPGQYLRTVHFQPHGIAGKPTVYLVSEHLVARAQARANQHDALRSAIH